ncbi:MAG: tRNA (adenosine(37)-N6)-dimethylallyltransferase MiaA [Thermoclostridium sp.]|nr:tRNA (adenosine(37)-N6)-dimethylallyltransferase MiaA [Thermoclostridium sp.]
MDKVVVICGPTASGKTDLAIALAQTVNGEIISADSMQVYQFMNIGTAKPTREEMLGIPHHILDVAMPDEPFSVALYKEKAEESIRDILSRTKLPIITGGTGLYINSLIYNIRFSETVCDEAFREKMNVLAAAEGPKALHDRLRAVDPESAERIHFNNVKRVIRALEVYEFTGKPITEHQYESRQEPAPYQYFVFFLDMDREELYSRIDKRVDRMLQVGLVDEVKALLQKGYKPGSTAMQGLGYKEIIRYLEGEISLDEAVYILKRDTRHYAKRQITWFKAVKGIIRLEAGAGNIEENTKIIREHLETCG